jgi:hypothetical protein
MDEQGTSQFNSIFGLKAALDSSEKLSGTAPHTMSKKQF